MDGRGQGTGYKYSLWVAGEGRKVQLDNRGWHSCCLRVQLFFLDEGKGRVQMLSSVTEKPSQRT